MAKEATYTLIRYYHDDKHPKRILKKGLTLKQAQAYCNNPETASNTCRLPDSIKHTEKYGDWFDGYVKET